MEDLRSAMLSNGYAKPVVDHALKRWVGGSNDDSYWRHWKQWCIDNNISPLAGEPASVAACLAHFEKDRGFKFIEKLKVAISTFMELLYGHDASDRISNHPVIKSQLKGSKKTKPSKPRWGKDDAWDVGLIPKYWSTQADNADLSVADLGFKVVSLWLAVGSARVSDVAHIARHSMSFPEDQHGKITGMRFQYWFTKELRRPVLTDFLFIPVHSDPKVCVVAAVRSYLDRTSDTSIFNHYPRLHLYSPEYDLSDAPPLLIMSVTNGIKFPIGPDRISKWMFSVMQKAGVPAKYTSGSARMASASRLLDNGQNPDYVIGLGRWTSNSIFNRHYNRSRLANMGILGITV